MFNWKSVSDWSFTSLATQSLLKIQNIIFSKWTANIHFSFYLSPFSVLLFELKWASLFASFCLFSYKKYLYCLCFFWVSQNGGELKINKLWVIAFKSYEASSNHHCHWQRANALQNRFPVLTSTGTNAMPRKAVVIIVSMGMHMAVQIAFMFHINKQFPAPFLQPIVQAQETRWGRKLLHLCKR